MRYYACRFWDETVVIVDAGDERTAIEKAERIARRRWAESPPTGKIDPRDYKRGTEVKKVQDISPRFGE